MSADVLLVTCAPLPDGEVDGHLLVEDLAARGVASRWVAWDDAEVDWPARRGGRGPQHLGLRVAARGVPGLGGECRAGRCSTAPTCSPGTPTRPTSSTSSRPGCPSCPACWPGPVTRWPPRPVGFGVAVVQARVGAGGRGVTVLDRPDVPVEGGRSLAGPAAGRVGPHRGRDVGVRARRRAVAQVRKVPGAGEVRVHEEYGGRSERRTAGGGARRAGRPDGAGRGGAARRAAWPTPGWT